MVTIVRGFELYSPLQFYQQLNRPDLVEEALKGDPAGKYADAASKLNLETILKSGPAPEIELLQKKTERTGGTVKLAIRLKDAGGGIGGKLLWRVNGSTQGKLVIPDLQGKPTIGRTAAVTQALKVDPSKSNIIEVTAFNGAELLASPPYKIIVDPFGVTLNERPKLFVLAIGVENYAMRDYQLHYPVKDAQDIAEAMKSAGKTLFSSVNVITLANAEATKNGIDTAVNTLATRAGPNDVMVLFLAGHGRSIAGRYYFLPQDLDFAKGQTIAKDGLSQDAWQQWLARIAAQKSLLILDTCESAAAASLVQGRGDRERQAAMEQLQYATGDNLIAAAKDVAYEGYKGHGVLTYAILEAFEKPKSGRGNQRIDVDGLAHHVSEKVPEISRLISGVAQEPILQADGNQFPPRSEDADSGLK